MTLQTLNITLLLVWSVIGSLNQRLAWPVFSVIFTALAFLFVFILSGLSIFYFFFYRRKIITHDATLLTTIGLLVSVFFIPLLIFLLSTVLPISHPLVIAFIYIIFLLLPIFRAPLPYLALPNTIPALLRLFRHPAFLALILVLSTQLICRFQYVFLPGLDAYTWLLKYEGSLPYSLYDLSAGPNRILFSTLVAVFYRLSHTPFFPLFKYWLPFISLLPVIPLWLIARTFKSRLHQFLFQVSLLASPTLILDGETTRHHLVLLLFLSLSLGLLYIGRRYQSRLFFWLTFLAAFIGILYHPLFLIMILLWLPSVFLLHRRFINRHPIVIVAFSLVLLLTTSYLKLTALFTNIIIRLTDAGSNFVSFHWNLLYPAAFVSEGLQMGWPGPLGVLKYYGYHAGPLPLFILFATFFCLVLFPSFRRQLLSYLFSPFLLPLTLLLLVMLFLAELLPRFAGIAYLPDRAWLILALPSLLLLPSLFRFIPTRRYHLFFSLIFVAVWSVSLAGTFYINHAIAFSIPDYELKAAAWMHAYLPADAYVFTSSSKNILRYYARVKLLRMEPEVISSSDPNPILSRIAEFSDLLDPAKVYIYYAVTDSRNPFITRQYASSYTQARPPSDFVALSSHSDLFDLIYSEPNLVYLWHVNN